MFNFIIGSDSVTLFLEGQSHTVNKDTPLFQKVIECVRDSDVEKLKGYLNIKQNILEQLQLGDPDFEMQDGVIQYKGYSLNRLLSARVLEMLKLGLDIKPMINFCKNLVNNPSKRAVDELFGFLEACKLPITADGHFLAYKRIREDYKDVHSGKFDNSVGKVLEMPRNQVDDDSSRTCSYGFHACSYDYLKHFSGKRIVVVNINPADVIVIPQDYNNSKMRICRYEVVAEIPLDQYQMPEEELPDYFTDEYDEYEDCYYEADDDDISEDYFDSQSDHLVGLPSIEEETEQAEQEDAVQEEDEQGSAKINLGIARTIRLMAKNDSCTVSHLASTFGISRRQVKRILDNEAWVE